MKRHHKQPWDWHEQRMAEGPQGFIRERGATTWEQLQHMCADFVTGWERLPKAQRDGYAYPNPEDRRHVA